MTFIDDINKFFVDEFDIAVADYKYVNVAGRYLYLEGHFGILMLSDDEIVFKLKKKAIHINGSDLKIKSFENSVAVVSGKIINVKVI